MALAAEEAAMIADLDARLTRLLNLAEMQIYREHPADARTTLAHARTTLGSEQAPKQLNDHARISGWISVSELSRQADDDESARSACDSAVTAMRGIEDPAVRCEYVMGVCNELQYLRGAPAAAMVLAESGPWTKAIDDVARRRQAVISFAAALFNLDDFTRGQQMLRQEDDAAWRSDTLTQLASLPVRSGWGSDYAADASVPAGAVEEMEMRREAATSQPWFGKQLRYRDVFRGQQRSQTEKD
jgi:hypothetical protein